MVRIIFLMLLICTLITSGWTIAGVRFDESSRVSTSIAKCIHESGSSIATLFVKNYDDIIVDFVSDMLNNLRNGGLRTQIALMYCLYEQPSINVNNFLKISKDLYEKVWIYPFRLLSYQPCQWMDRSTNCQRMVALLNQFKKNSINVGIISDESNLSAYYDNQCPQLGAFDLYWTGDNQPNFNDFKPFGGWTKPYKKQYGYKSMCGTSVFVTYQP